MSITSTGFGTTSSGEPVTLFTITNSGGSSVELLDLGCIVRAVLVPDTSGKLVDVVLGYDSVKAYEDNHGNYFGAAIGRHANRIGKGCFSLGGKEYTLALNNGANHLHGGDKGFDSYVWSHKITGESSIVFFRTSPDGEEGYPGKLDVTVSYTFGDDCSLLIGYDAVSDADTVINLTNHSYFNLDGGGKVLDHLLTIRAYSFTPNDNGCLPTGEIAQVTNTPFDFTAPKAIGKDIFSDHPQIAMFGGYDHNFCLAGSGYRHVATLTSPASGISMEVHTTKPGVQLYTASATSEHVGKGGTAYGKHSAACLETQYFPNAMACPHFPSPVLVAGERYSHKTAYTFSVRR